MFAKFFIERPIFAWVVAILITGTTVVIGELVPNNLAL